MRRLALYMCTFIHNFMCSHSCLYSPTYTSYLLYQSYYRCKWVRFCGDEFRISDGVITEMKHDLPIIGVIKEILIVNGDKIFFHVDQYGTSFEPHYRAYILEEQTFSSGEICFSYLFIEKSLFIRTSHILELSHSFVLLPFALCTCE